MEISGGKVDPPSFFGSCNPVGDGLLHRAQIGCPRSVSAEMGEDHCSKTRISSKMALQCGKIASPEALMEAKLGHPD